MKYLILFFVLGQCVQLTKGVFKGEFWVIEGANSNHTYRLRQNNYYLTEVRESYLSTAEQDQCK